MLNEAEYTVIGAGLGAAHERGFKRQAERLFNELADVNDARVMMIILDQEVKGRARC